MTLRSGLSAQVGFAAESTYATYIAPVRYLEFLKESIKNNVDRHYTRSVGDMVQRSSRFRAFSKGCGGGIDFEVQNMGFGLLFKQLFGNGSVAQVGGTTEYKHTFIPDLTNGGFGVSATLQIGRPDVGNTVDAFSYLGAKCVEWEFSSELDQALMLSTTWDAQSETTVQALGSQSLSSGSQPLIFADASVTIDAGSVSVRSIKVKGQRGMDTDRRFLGAITSKKEQIANGEFAITGELDMEFESLTQYNKYVAGTPIALVATWSFGTITGAANPYKLTITIPVAVYEGETPTVQSSEVLRQPLPFKALWNGSAALMTLDYNTSDTAL